MVTDSTGRRPDDAAPAAEARTAAAGHRRSMRALSMSRVVPTVAARVGRTRLIDNALIDLG